MSFAQIDEKRTAGNKSTFRKTEYIDLPEGQHIIRVLESSATKVYVHYMGFAYVKCLGDECPICQNNKKILFESPEDYRDQKGWKPRTSRFYVNVLDKTKAKICPTCGAEYKNLNLATCSKDNTILPEAAPLNKVKVLAKGSGLFEELEIMSNTTRNEQDEVVDIRTYDFLLNVSGRGKDTKTTPVPRYIPGREDMTVLEGENQLFDLSKTTPTLTADEMLDVFNGASLKDIFAVRRATKEAEKVAQEPVGDSVLMSDINAAVDDIFKS